MLQKLDNQGFTFTDDGRVIVVDKYGAVKRLTNLTLTTIGTSGPATLIGNVLNIPDYTEMYFGTVTSVGLSMPAAFTVTNSPITTAGTLTVTAAGLVSQYVRGDGTLADFPGSTGGGSSVSYYLNGSVNQGVFGGNTYYQMSRTPVTGAGTNFSIAANGYIASFITDANDPSLISIPSGGWNIQLYMSANLSGGSPNFYIELYKYDGAVFTLISSSSTTPESITGGTSVDLYYTSISVPTTALTVTDRLAIRIYVNNSGRTITLRTEGTNLAEIVTTFTTGLTAMNGLTAQVQYLTTGTSGTDFNISSATATHTFNLPVASALNTGKLSNTDWTTFNAKQDALSLTTTGSSGASTLIGSTLNVPAYTLSGLGGVPTSRTLTVNGTAYDLSADRSWSVGTVTSVAATAGTGISISGSPITGSGTLTITNTAPDQTVALTAGTGIGVSGTYPNFTITNTSPSSGGTVTSVAALTLGTTGTDLSSTVANPTTTPVITLNVPTASATNRGALSSADWTTFNGKVGGSGTTNYLSKWTSSSALGDSLVYDNGTNVGIGNTSPSAKLDVTASNGEIRSTGTAASYTQYNAFITSGVNMRIGAYATNYGYLGTTTNHPFIIETNNTERARFTAGGNFGIGTASPSYKLDVIGDIRSSTGTYLTSATAGTAQGFANNGIGLVTFGLNTSGNALVVNDIDGAKFAVSTGGFSTTFYKHRSTDNIYYKTFVIKGSAATSYGTGYDFYVGTSIAATIDGSGNMGIGTASPTTKITMFGQNPTFRVQGDGVSYYGGIDFWSSVSGTNRQNGSIGQYDANGLYIGAGTGMRLTFTVNNGTEAMRLNSTGNLLINTTTDAGYKLDVNGTARAKEYLYLLRSDGAATIAALRYTAANTVDIGNTFRVVGTNRWQNTIGTSSYIDNNYYTKVFASVPQANGNWTMYDFQLFSSMAPNIAASYNQKVIGTAFTIESTAVNSFFGVDVRATDNSVSIANNVYAIYADATLGTNTSATRWAGYFVGRGYFSQVLSIGTTSPNASALLDVTSTNKGFLPPRMTTAQKNAITTPATGLVVFDTTLAKLCVYTGAAWETVTSA